jgi:NAD(P)-dependent dehydrogenase (short-subunit alcohol dehydrogenase family)
MFDGRVALVTGGTRGIGAAITEKLAKGGAHVAAGYSRGKEGAETLQRKLEGEGAKVSVHQGRVDDPQDCQRVVSEVLERFGRIDY